MTQTDKTGFCIVSYPLGKAFATPVTNLSAILSEIGSTQVIIGSFDPIDIPPKKDLTVHYIPYHNGPLKIRQIIRFIVLNVRIVYALLSLRHTYTRVIYFMESCPLIPMIFSVLFRKKIYWLLPSKNTNLSNSLISGMEMVISLVGYRLSDHIIVYSPNIISAWNLEPYYNKIRIAHEHFLNFKMFFVRSNLSDRPPLIGYIGRLSEEKGVQNFVRALPAVLGDHKDLFVLIGGDGTLSESIADTLKSEGLASRVSLPGWISRKDIPCYLNRLRILVLPSSTEGLPNIMIEAMACGTPVLATAVGAIPDIIKHGETGFIMDNNSPACVAENITRALKNDDLEKIAVSAKNSILREFTFESTVQQWKGILE